MKSENSLWHLNNKYLKISNNVRNLQLTLLILVLFMSRQFKASINNYDSKNKLLIIIVIVLWFVIVYNYFIL